MVYGGRDHPGRGCICVLEAAKNHVTLGEMCDVLQGVYGEYREPPTYW